MKYVPKRIELDACLYEGHEKPFELEGVRLIRYEGVSGYSAKLAYVENKTGVILTVRPGDYVVKEGDDIRMMPSSEFVEKYEPVLKKSSTRARKKIEEDNVSDDDLKDALGI